MSREIKFRAWHKKEKRMVEITGLGWDNETGELIYALSGVEAIPIVEIEDLLEFTGLVDVDGTEIYEGDVVASPNEFNRMKKYLVVHSCLCFSLERIREDKNLNGTLDSFLSTWEKSKVIGNKFTHPELLED